MKNSELAQHLKKIFPAERLLLEKEERIVYSYDATGTKFIPEAVVFPENEEEVRELFKLANDERIPLVFRGAGTGMSGGSVPLKGGVVISTERMNRILEIDEVEFIATVEPGVVTSRFQKEVEKLGLFYPPDPASSEFCTIGGNISENAGGLRALKYGVTRDWVMGLRVVLPGGAIFEAGKKTLKGVVGYDMVSLFVGSEGTLGFISKAYLKLIPKPQYRTTLLVHFKNLEDACNSINSIFLHKILPSALELIDRNSLECVRESGSLNIDRNVQSSIIVEMDGEEVIEKQVEKLKRIFSDNNALFIDRADDEENIKKLWDLRRKISPSLRKIAPNKINEDVVVPRRKILNLLKEVYVISQKYGMKNANFGHGGDGNIHINFLFNKDNEDEVHRANLAVEELMKVVVRLGGTISGEHGIGISKKKYLPIELDDEAIDIMKRIKRSFDPFNIINPGKIFP